MSPRLYPDLCAQGRSRKSHPLLLALKLRGLTKDSKKIRGTIPSQVIKRYSAMQAILKTTNPATLNFAEAILKEARIGAFVADQHASIIEGSIGAIPRRLMVLTEDKDAAIRALELAGLGHEIFRD